MTRWENKSQGSRLTSWAPANHCHSLGPCSLVRRMGELDGSDARSNFLSEIQLVVTYVISSTFSPCVCCILRQHHGTEITKGM